LLFFLIILSIITINSQLLEKDTDVRSEATSETKSNVVEVEVKNSSEGHAISPYIWGVNGMGGTVDAATPSIDNNLVSTDMLNSAGIRKIRYPAGCGAPGMNWRDSTMNLKKQDGESRENVLPIDDAVTMANQINGILYYTVNIEIHHDVPSPCGWFSLYPGTPDKAKNKEILLQDAHGI
ncbi:MAG: hypothetical protein ACOCXT_06160, partial [Candidatus Dojkabacteria bacterium]